MQLHLFTGCSCMKIFLFLILLFQFCSSTQNRNVETAILKEQTKEYIQDALNFDCSNYADADKKMQECENLKKKSIALVKNITSELEKKDTANTVLIDKNKTLQSKADKYDFWRNLIIAASIGIILYIFRDSILVIVKKFIL